MSYEEIHAQLSKQIVDLSAWPCSPPDLVLDHQCSSYSEEKKRYEVLTRLKKALDALENYKAHIDAAKKLQEEEVGEEEEEVQ